MTVKTLISFGCLLLGSLVHAQAQAQGQAQVHTIMEPRVAKVGRPIAYTVIIVNGNVDGRSLPAFDNLPPQLQFQGGPQVSQQIDAAQSGVTRSTRLQWQFTATEAGTFIVPSQALTVDGQPVQTEEQSLTVEDYTAEEKKAMEEAPRPLLQMQLGKKEFYQGELVPVYCSFILPRNYGVRRFGLIDIPKADFAIARFPQQGEQSMEVIGDQGYCNFTFRSTLSALRSGSFQIGPAVMNPELEVPVEDPRAMNLPPGFSRGFPRGFMSMTEPRQIHVESPPVTVTVLPLPAEGKPASFSGAVGDFVLTAKATPTRLTVGDPIAVDLVIEGKGNFDALTEPVLSAPDGWKSYPAKRYNLEGQVTQNEVATLERKIGYTQVFMPEAVHKELPPFEISFFSPTKKQYVTLKTPAVPLEITPAAPIQGQAAGAGSGTPVVENPPPADASPPQANQTDIIVRPPQAAHWVQPAGLLLVRNQTFWAAQAVPVLLLLLAGIGAVVRRRRLARASGRAGELRAAWAQAQGSLAGSDAEFLRGGARFIHTVQGEAPVQEEALRQLLSRYETGLFTAEGGLPPLPKEERQRMQRALGALYQQALSCTASLVLVAALAVMALGQGQAQAAEQGPESPDQVYLEARELVEKGDFARAQYLGEGLLKRNPPAISPELFQLLGDARYRQKDNGRAVLWYQRALLAGQGSPELRQNLEFLQKKLGFVSFRPESPLAQWSLVLSHDQWVLLAAGGGWLLLLGAAWRVWSGRRAATAAVAMSAIGLLVAVPAVVMALVRPTVAERVDQVSVVVLPDMAALAGAAEQAGSVMDLPPGSQVRVLEERGPWRYVELPLRLEASGRKERLRGWVPAVALTPLWPWEPGLVR